MKFKNSILKTLSIGTLSLIPFMQITSPLVRSAYGDSNPCSQNSATAGMKQQYCDSANAQKKASISNLVISGIFGAAGAVCGVACVTKDPISSVNLESVCTVTSQGAGASDFAASQSFEGAVGSLVSVSESNKNPSIPAAQGATNAAANGTTNVSTAAGNAAAPPGVEINAIPDQAPLNVNITSNTNPGAANTASNGATNGADKAGAKPQDKKDSNSSCKSAAMNMGLAGMQMFSANEADNAAQKNIENATEVNTTPADTSFSFSAPQNSAQLASATVTGGASASNRAASTAPAGSSSISGQGGGDSCASAKATGNLQSALACAAATGTSLPPIVQHPNFGEMIKKATGMDAADFLKKAMNEGPGKAVGEAVVQGAGLNGNAAIQTAATFSALERAGYESSAGMYVGSGGRKGNSDSGADLGQMVQGLMAQFNPKTGSEGKPSSPLQLKLQKSPERFPANVAEDRRVSLFERVTHRYHAVADRVMPGQR